MAGYRVWTPLHLKEVWKGDETEWQVIMCVTFLVPHHPTGDESLLCEGLGEVKAPVTSRVAEL